MKTLVLLVLALYFCSGNGLKYISISSDPADPVGRGLNAIFTDQNAFIPIQLETYYANIVPQANNTIVSIYLHPPGNGTSFSVGIFSQIEKFRGDFVEDYKNYAVGISVNNTECDTVTGSLEIRAYDVDSTHRYLWAKITYFCNGFDKPLIASVVIDYDSLFEERKKFTEN